MPRLFNTESVQDAATFLKARANSDILWLADINGSHMLKYLRDCHVQHRPTGVSVKLTREATQTLHYYHMSICFVNDTSFLPYDESKAAEWLRAVFGERVAEVQDITDTVENPIGKAKGVRHYMLLVTDFNDQRLS